MKNNLSIFNNLRPLTVGFDNMFDHFEHMLDDSFFSNGTAGNFPPYNIVKTGDHTYNIELALAGWSADQIEVSTEQNVLLVKSKEQDPSTEEEEYVHRGVASRTFARGFNLSDDVELGKVSFVNGMLTIELQKVIPEHQKRKVYDIV